MCECVRADLCAVFVYADSFSNLARLKTEGLFTIGRHGACVFARR